MNEPKKPFFLVRLIRFMFGQHKISTLIIVAAILCAAGVNAYLIIVVGKPVAITKVTPVKVVPKPIPVVVKYYSPLTGLEIANEAGKTAPVTAIMIENSPEARPQSGLKAAGVVFEAIAEGGITRFMAVYQSEKPQLIGPVRSVRPYYISWAAAFNASIAHVGGSADALDEVRNGNYRDIDQFFNSATYWRSTDRYAPHNVYTSFEKLDALNSTKGYTSSTFTGFTRAEGKASLTPNATRINVTISSSLFNSTYAYNATTNSYDRSQAGAPHLDREDGQISPNTVVAMYVNEYTESDGHENITSVGSGNAVIFQNGVATNAIWTKSSKTEQLKFTDSAGVVIPLNNGKTWIVAVPNNGGDVTWL